MNNNITEFIWIGTESAPHYYPMEIIQGSLDYHDKDGGFSLPYGGTLSSGWGRGISNHHIHDGPMPLPDRLKIIFFSYTEKQFYSGEFDLPYEKIRGLFQDGVENPKVFPQGQTRPIYNKVMVGIAPGGAVAVWVKGHRKVEIFFGQAEKIKIDPSSAFRLPFKNKQESDEYIAEGLAESLSPEKLELLKKNGIPFGLWSRYRQHYNWEPTASAGDSISKLNVHYLNGEFFGKWGFSDKKEPTIQRPVPSKMSFRSLDNTLYTVTFNEFEIMDAFEKLGSNSEKVVIEFEPRLPRADIKARIYNNEESIELKKFVSKK